MAAEAEAEITKNDGNASQIKDSAVARLGFQSAAALLRAHGGGRAEPSRDGGILSPRFRSAAAMAGWDEEALLLASLVVEDTPVREGSKHKKRSAARVKSPPTTNSQRKRRSRRQSPPIPPVTLSLDDEETTGEVALVPDPQKTETEAASSLAVEKEKGRENDVPEAAPAAVTIPCMQRLREELSCAICLDICFEPSTTPCGHSFCKKCLKCAATKCGKRCPKCRELIGNGRSCTVNTVLWNTIQLLFPEEIEARKKSSLASSRCKRSRTSSPGGGSSNGSREADSSTRNANIIGIDSSTRNANIIGISSREADSSTRNANIIGISSRRRSAARAARLREGEESVRRTTPPNQSEDAALALRLQREEFMEAFRETQQPNTITTSTYSARANLRAIASRAIQMRIRRRS